MIGVICACAPSLSKMLQEHPPSYEITKSRLQSPFKSTSQFLSKGSAKSSSRDQRRDSDSGDHIFYEERLTGGKIASDRGYELHNGNFFRHFVGEGPGGFAVGDGSHVKSEILQEHAAGDELYQGNKCIWAPLPAVTEANMV